MAFFDIFKKKTEDNNPADNISAKPIAAQNKKPEGGLSKQTVNWPRIGSDTAYLAGAHRFKVFADASFIKSPAFAAFSAKWHQGKTPETAARFYFVPSFEKAKLTSEQTALMNLSDFKEYHAADLSDCFGKIQSADWKIIWLTASVEEGSKVQKLASDNGILLRWYSMDEEGKLKSLFNRSINEDNNTYRPFRLATQLAPVSKATEAPAAVPKSGERVICGKDGAVYMLKDAVMTDHSSITYATNDPSVYAKIYTAKALGIDLFENKAKRMVKEDVNIRGVCWPKDILKNNGGAFVGILVPAAKGVQLTRSVLNGAAGIKQYFPKWNKKDICVLAQTILEIMYKVNRLGLLFGCFNPASVYIAGTTEVYFVDTDAWQVEGYPVISRNITFTPPELLTEEKKPVMYTLDTDNYQAALLAFMLMMPGKYPYAKRKTNSESDSIRDMAFPFSISGDMKRSEDAERPSGIWQIVWDHLPYRMCDNFYNTFHANGKFAKPGTRIKTGGWLGAVSDFAKYLDEPEAAESRALFPATFRHSSKRTFVRCSVCGQEHPSFYFMHNIRIQKEKINIWDKGYRVCLPCAVDKSKSEEGFKCRSCDRQFFYTNKTKIIHEIGKLDFDWNDQKWCRDCKKRTKACSNCGSEVAIYQLREFEDRRRNIKRSVCGKCFSELLDSAKRWRDGVYQRKLCRCGREIIITNGDAEFLSQKGWNLPSHCSVCRGRRY